MHIQEEDKEDNQQGSAKHGAERDLHLAYFVFIFNIHKYNICTDSSTCKLIMYTKMYYHEYPLLQL